MTTDEKRQIHRLAAEGMSNRAIARLCDTSHVTVAKVLKEPPPLAELPAHMAPPTAPSEPDDGAPGDDAPAIVQARYLMRQAREALRNANAVGDSQLAQRQTRNAAFLANVLARLERAEQDASGGFHLQAGDIAAAESDLDTRLAALAERQGLRCADCSRALSIKWGTGE